MKVGDFMRFLFKLYLFKKTQSQRHLRSVDEDFRELGIFIKIKYQDEEKK